MRAIAIHDFLSILFNYLYRGLRHALLTGKEIPYEYHHSNSALLPFRPLLMRDGLGTLPGHRGRNQQRTEAASYPGRTPARLRQFLSTPGIYPSDKSTIGFTKNLSLKPAGLHFTPKECQAVGSHALAPLIVDEGQNQNLPPDPLGLDQQSCGPVNTRCKAPFPS